MKSGATATSAKPPSEQNAATRSPGLTAAPSGALRTTPPTSLPGTNGSSGFIWYSPRVCSTSGNETPAAWTSTRTPLPGVIGCDGSGSGTSTSRRAVSGPVSSTICCARMAQKLLGLAEDPLLLLLELGVVEDAAVAELGQLLELVDRVVAAGGHGPASCRLSPGSRKPPCCWKAASCCWACCISWLRSICCPGWAGAPATVPSPSRSMFIIFSARAIASLACGEFIAADHCIGAPLTLVPTIEDDSTCAVPAGVGVSKTCSARPGSRASASPAATSPGPAGADLVPLDPQPVGVVAVERHRQRLTLGRPLALGHVDGLVDRERRDARALDDELHAARHAERRGRRAGRNRRPGRSRKPGL